MSFLIRSKTSILKSGHKLQKDIAFVSRTVKMRIVSTESINYTYGTSEANIATTDILIVTGLFLD